MQGQWDADGAPMHYEKHRAVARAPRPGVYGGSAPDAAKVIQKHQQLFTICDL